MAQARPPAAVLAEVDGAATASDSPSGLETGRTNTAHSAPVLFPSSESATSSIAADEDEDPPDCEASGSALYCVYTVQSGDILSVIAARFAITGTAGLSAAEILAHSNKPAVAHPDAIVAGLKLRVPQANGIIHTVLVAETLADVAVRYGVTVAEIAALPINGIADSDLLLVGQELLVPDPAGVFRRTSQPPPSLGNPDATPTVEAQETPAAGSATPEATTPPSATPTQASPISEEEASATPTPAETGEAEAPDPTNTPTPVPAKATATPRAPSTPTPSGGRGSGSCQEYVTQAPTADANLPSAAGFIWPALGPISSCFGPGHPLGIDIDLFADPNQAIRAAAAGIVTFAGGNPCCSYGFYVVIDHGSGFTTLYAHFSALRVSAGQLVGQGDVLGLAGRTGFATGNHLHFEMLFQGDTIDPVPFLP